MADGRALRAGAVDRRVAVTSLVTVMKALSSLCYEPAIPRAKPVAVGDDRR